MRKKTDKQSEVERAEVTEPGEAAVSEPEALRAERDQLQAQLKRAMADLQNIRKRHIKEMDDARHRAIEGLSAELLPVLDNFYLALDAHRSRDAETGEGSADVDSMVEGLRMVRSLLHGVLERHGLAEIPAHGEPFDPNVHEAVGIEPSKEVKSGEVARVMLRGYRLGERVLRPTKVIVAGDNAANQQAPDDEPTDS